MSVDELVTMNDKSRKQAYRHGLVSGFCLGAGLGSVAAVFIILKFAREIVGIYTAIL